MQSKKKNKVFINILDTDLLLNLFKYANKDWN